VFQDGLDDLRVFNETDDSHDSPTPFDRLRTGFRAGQGINLVNLLDQLAPVLPIFFRTLIRFQDTGDPVVFGFFPLSPGDPAKRGTVIPIVPDPLFPPVRDMGTHGRQPLQRIEDLFLRSVFRPVKHLGRTGRYCIRSWEKEARIIYRARFSMAVSSWGNMRSPQKTWKPE